jgi:hypothetical protein
MRVPFFILFISLNSFAIIGEYADKNTELDSTCMINFQYKDYSGKKVSGACSASYIGGRKFTSVEHCREDIGRNLADQTLSPPTVKCPKDDFISITKTYLNRDFGFNESQDFLVFETKSKPQNTKPILIPKNENEIESLIKENKNCYINGYGINNDGKYGELKSAKVEFQTYKSLLSSAGNEVTIVGNNQAHHGDSGGPLYCQTQSGPVLIGVIHGIYGGSKKTDIEKINQYTTWLNYLAFHDDVNEEFFRSWNSVNSFCESNQKCINKLVELGIFNEDVKSIILKLNQNYNQIQKDLNLGQKMEAVEVKQLWDEMSEFWDKNNCYNRIYN